MNRCKAFTFLLLILVSFPSLAQKDKWKFHSINTVGITTGESGSHPILQTVNGFGNSEWYAGIGFGADYYPHKTYPLFVDARMTFGKKNNWFVYGDLGYNFSMDDKPGKGANPYVSYDFSGGIYTDFGAGFKTKFIKNTALLFSLGHSYKKLDSKVGTTICPFVGPCYVDYTKYQFDYGRIILKAGLLF